jgi:hypothetical protein
LARAEDIVTRTIEIAPALPPLATALPDAEAADDSAARASERDDTPDDEEGGAR